MNADDESPHPHQGVQFLQDKLSFDFIIEDCFKNREEFPGIKALYQQFRISDGDFDQIVSLLKKSMIGSKLFKMPQLKVAITQLNIIRDLIVYDKDYNATEEEKNDKSLYERLGKIIGISKIMETVFKYIKQDEGLFKFYKDKDISVV
jgi:hypothetical protein